MRTSLVVLFLAVIIGSMGFVYMSHKETSNVDVTVDEIVIHTGDLDVCFTRGEKFSATYMLFGGEKVTGKNAILPFFISGIDAEEGKRIAEKYPDFWECKSPGAAQAQSGCEQFHVLPSRPKIEEEIKSALKQFRKALGTEEDRVCLMISGDELKLKSVIYVETDQDVTMQFAHQFESLDCRLITHAQMKSWLEFLGAGQ